MLLDEPVQSDMRTEYAASLIREGHANHNLVVMGADTTDSLKTAKFGREFPDRFFNVGIAEGNLVSISAGLATSGKRVFASTYAIFLPGRAVDQIRNNIAYPSPEAGADAAEGQHPSDAGRRGGLDVKLVASHGGLSVGPDGGSHQQLEDISIMRTIPNFRVFVPADTVAVSALTHIMASEYGPFYMRMARSKTPIVHSESQTFARGGSVLMRDGSDCTIAACGITVRMALEAAELLWREKQISCRVLDMYSIKPVDAGALERAARETGRIVSVEEHNVVGGMGSAIAETVSGSSYPVPIKRIGALDMFGESARDGEVPLLLQKHGITSFNISQVAAEMTDG